MEVKLDYSITVDEFLEMVESVVGSHIQESKLKKHYKIQCIW